MTDSKLIKRVKEFLKDSDVPLQKMNAEYIADELREFYPREYRRKPKIPFQIAVNKILKTYVKEMNLNGDFKFIGSEKNDLEQNFEKDSIKRPHSFCNLNKLITNEFNKNEISNKTLDKELPLDDESSTFFIDTLGSKKLKKDDNSANKNEKQLMIDDHKIAEKELKVSQNIENKIKIKSAKKEKMSSYEVLNSEEKFSDLIGMDEIINKLNIILLPFKERKFCLCSRGILISGPSGCGKSKLGRTIISELKLPFIYVSSIELMAGVGVEREDNVNKLFQQAINIQPCFILIDHIDLFNNKNDNHTTITSSEKQMMNVFIKNIDDLRTEKVNHMVWLIGLARKKENVDGEFLREGRFEKEFNLLLPNVLTRSLLLNMFFNSFVHDFQTETDFPDSDNKHEENNDLELEFSPNCSREDHGVIDVQLSKDISFEDLAHKTPAYSGFDLKKLIRETLLQSFYRFKMERLDKITKTSMVVEMVDFEMALQIVKPTTMIEDNVLVPETTWENIGALKKIRDELFWLILRPIKFPKLMKESGLSKPEGVMLFGPPGCGKTLVAKALANEASLNFLSVKGPELIDKYVGESEKNIRALFQRAKECSPCLIFFDEIDSISERRRSSHSEGGGVKVVEQLLSVLDGVESRDGVNVMGATNRLDCVDPALLRENRFSTLLYIGLPSAEGRLEILLSLTKKGTVPKMSCDLNLKDVAFDTRCEGLNGADLAHLIKMATRFAWKSAFASADNVTEILVTKDHFEMALSEIKPSVSPEEITKYEKMAKRYDSTSRIL